MNLASFFSGQIRTVLEVITLGLKRLLEDISENIIAPDKYRNDLKTCTVTNQLSSLMSSTWLSFCCPKKHFKKCIKKRVKATTMRRPHWRCHSFPQNMALTYSWKQILSALLPVIDTSHFRFVAGCIPMAVDRLSVPFFLNCSGSTKCRHSGQFFFFFKSLSLNLQTVLWPVPQLNRSITVFNPVLFYFPK